MPASLSTLPPEIFDMVMESLGIKDLRALFYVSKCTNTQVKQYMADNWERLVCDAALVGWCDFFRLPFVVDDPYDDTAMSFACFGNQPALLAMLLQRGHFPQEDAQQRLLEQACRNNKPLSLKVLLADPRINATLCTNELFQIVCWLGHVEVAEVLLADERTDPAVNESAALRNACSQGHLGVARILLRDGRADPPQLEGIGFSQDITQALLKDGRVDPTYNYNDPLFVACGNGQEWMVDLLCKDGRVDASLYGNAALREACSMLRVSVVRRLLEEPSVRKALSINPITDMRVPCDCTCCVCQKRGAISQLLADAMTRTTA